MKYEEIVIWRWQAEEYSKLGYSVGYTTHGWWNPLTWFYWLNPTAYKHY